MAGLPEHDPTTIATTFGVVSAYVLHSNVVGMDPKITLTAVLAFAAGIAARRWSEAIYTAINALVLNRR